MSGWMPTFLQFLHRVLCGLGFQFLCSGDVGHIGEVDAEAVLAKFPTELAHGFEIGKRLDVADSAADFSDDEIEIAGVAEQLYVSLDFVGDMRHNLYGLAKIVAAAFLIDNALVDTSGGDVVGACGLDVGKPLVVTEVEVGFVAVDSYVAFAVLVWVECSRVDVDVGVEFLDCYFVAASFEQTCKRRRDNAFTKGGNDASGDENIFGIHAM